MGSSARVSQSQSATAPKKGGNPEAAKIKNPVAASAESTAAGQARLHAHVRPVSRA